MEEVDAPPDVKEEKPEIMEEVQIPVRPVQLKIIVKGGADKAGQGNLDHSQFVEMAQLARQAVTIANKLVGKANKRKQLLVPRSEVASGVMIGDVAKDNSNGAQRLNEKGRETDAEGMRKERAALSDEKLAVIRKKNAERMRGWRALLSEEELAAVRKREAERKRNQNRRNRNLKEENERRRQKRAAWTDEERAAHRKKEAERQRRLREAMSEEERAEYRRKDAERQRRKTSLIASGEIEHLRAVDADGKRIRKTGMTPDEVAQGKRMQKLTEEKKAEIRQRTVINKLMKRATMTEEEKEEQRWKKRMQVYARQAKKTREERQQENRRDAERNRKWRKRLTGEKLERYKESNRKALKKYEAKNPQALRYRRRVTEETPEQRWRRLSSYRIGQAKRLLKKKLEREGFPQEEIEKKLKDLVAKMKEEPMPPPEAVSAYKPRPRKNCRESVKDSQPATSAVRTTRSKFTFAPNSSKDSSLFSNMKTIEAEPIVDHVQLVQFSTDSFADHKEIFNDGAEFADAFNDSDIQSDPLGNDKEGSDIEELSSNSDLTSRPASPVETSQTSKAINDCFIQSVHLESKEDNEDDIEEITSSFLAPPPPPMAQPIAASPQPCPHCLATFNEQNLLKDHLRSSHLNKCFKCPKCKEVVLSPKELSDHFKTHQTPPQNEEKSSTSTFACIKCPTVGFQSQEKLSEHVRLSHPGSFFPCQYCKVIMYNKSSLATHLTICKMSTEQDSVVPRKGSSRNSKLKKCTDW